jgi:ankyrin repeat protein
LAEHLIAHGAKPNAIRRPRALGETALHVAANDGALEVVQCLLANGWDLEAVDKNGKRPLHHACDFPGWDTFDEIDRSAVVAYLLGQGAAAAAEDASGQSPLQQAEANSIQLGPKEREAILKLLRETETS